MKRILFIVILTLNLVGVAWAQESVTLTGTALIYGSGLNTRTVTRTFTLRIDARTPESEIPRLLNILQEQGQEDLLKEIRGRNLGSFSLGGSIGHDLNAVSIENTDSDHMRIRAVFERWLGFGEIRNGYRSLDYPFGYLEIVIDRRTGKGDGTFIPAAKIRFREKNGGQVEIEDFGTFPAKLLGVELRKGRLP